MFSKIKLPINTASIFASQTRAVSNLPPGVTGIIPPVYRDQRVEISIAYDRLYDASQKQGFMFRSNSLVFELHPIVPVCDAKTHGFDRTWEWGLYAIADKIFTMRAYFNDKDGSQLFFPSLSVQYDLPAQSRTAPQMRADLMAVSLLNVDEKRQDALIDNICEAGRQVLEPPFTIVDQETKKTARGMRLGSNGSRLYGPAPARDSRLIMSSVLHAFGKFMPATLLVNSAIMSLSPAALTLMIIEELYGEEYAKKIAGEFGRSKQFVESLTGSHLQPFAVAQMKARQKAEISSSAELR